MKAIRLLKSQIFEGPLVLVNREHPLRNTAHGTLTPVDDRYPDILLEYRTAQLLSECIRKAGGTDKIVPVSGWRSQEEQQRIWDETMAESGEKFTRRYVAFPGCSEHQTGLAIDLGKTEKHIDFIRPSFPYDGACGAFRKLAAKYGFIERYQRSKESITGIGHEPWHFRYVGIPHAILITENGLCLEEYGDFVKERTRSCVLENGQLVQVFYVPCAGEETEAELPEGCCQISGDNVGGFIVTSWGRAL